MPRGCAELRGFGGKNLSDLRNDREKSSRVSLERVEWFTAVEKTEGALFGSMLRCCALLGPVSFIRRETRYMSGCAPVAQPDRTTDF
jgi:hypothetical protein